MDASENTGREGERVVMMVRMRKMMIVHPPPLWRVRLASMLFFTLVTFYVHTEGLRIHT